MTTSSPTNQNPNPSLSQILTHFGRELAARQFAIYRAEWALEAEPAGDPMEAVQALVRGQLEFHGICHHPDLKAALAASPADDVLAQELRRLVAHAEGIPLSTMETAVGAALATLQAWHQARAANDFAIVLPYFTQLITIQRELATIKAANLSKHYGRLVTPYEALIDAYDPGRSLDFTKREFARLVPVCQSLLRDADLAPIGGAPFSTAGQEALGRDVMIAMGYDATPPRGKLATSAHPFCRRVGPDEVWLTNRYEEREFLATLLTMVHEGGHGRYYQGLPRELSADWLGMIASETINEGMALFAENIIARRPAFAQFLAPKISQYLDTQISANQLYAHMTAPTRDPIRAEAGEACYPLHLILRLEVEEALINGGMNPAELPAFWNKRSAELLGITPASDAEGCLQDIHLFAGYLGYFPCYLLGHMAAAQLWPALEAAEPEIEDQLAEGDFLPLNNWLTATIYRHGRLLAADALVKQVTGHDFTADALISHLNARYNS